MLSPLVLSLILTLFAHFFGGVVKKCIITFYKFFVTNGPPRSPLGRNGSQFDQPFISSIFN